VARLIWDSRGAGILVSDGDSSIPARVAGTAAGTAQNGVQAVAPS